MAATPATKVTPDEGKWVYYTGGAGDGDNTVVLELDGRGALEIIAISTLGAFDVLGSLDGTNFSANPIALEDLTSTTPATRVVVSTADKAVRVPTAGFRKLRFQQAGGTAPTNLCVAVRVKSDA
jgi:hypothetical protein